MTQSPSPAWAHDFPAFDEAQWRALAEKSLKGAPLEKLTGKTADGLPIAPLYRESDAEPGLPGHAPFTRGARAVRDPALPWHIRQVFAHPDPGVTNQEILEDLQRGVSSIELVLDPEGEAGIAIRNAADLDTALAGVHVDLAPVALDAGAHGLWAAQALEKRLKGLAAAETAFNLDPVGVLMRQGAMRAADLDEAARFAARVRETLPETSALRVDARPVHEAGGSEAQELGAALAIGVHYLRALTKAGLSPAEANRALVFTLSVGPDVLIETAKLRALRLAWARVMEAAGAPAPARAAKIHAITSARMLTRRDAWSNILRGTASCFAAALGGAEAISVLPLTHALGLPTPFARRVARNTQITLMEESRIGAVIDPAGGSFFVEEMTTRLAEAGWAKMQAIEAAGGIVAALTSGTLQGDIAAARAAREKAFATRRETVTGVTDFPLIDERMPDVATIDRAEMMSRLGAREATAEAPDTNAAPLHPIRWAAPFEAFRDAGDRAGNPGVFFANLGPLAEFSPRANFARNLLAAGGLGAIGPESVHAHHAALCAQWAASGARAAILTGSDARYAEEAGAAAQALKAAGCPHVLYAGKPADEAALKAAGIDQFVFAGQNALDALGQLHRALGIAA